jgi:hypothetical protein
VRDETDCGKTKTSRALPGLSHAGGKNQRRESGGEAKEPKLPIEHLDPPWTGIDGSVSI